MEIRQVPNENILELLALAVEMYKAIDIDINAFGAINTIMHQATTQQDFVALGMYEEDKLIGFVTGHYFSKNTFYFSGIYVIIKNNRWTKELIEYAFAYIKKMGYSACVVDATNGNISSIMEKYGATVKYTRYIKEMD